MVFMYKKHGRLCESSLAASTPSRVASNIATAIGRSRKQNPAPLENSRDSQAAATRFSGGVADKSETGQYRKCSGVISRTPQQVVADKSETGQYRKASRAS